MKKFPVFATLFTILGVSILCGLGIWQLQRLEWKNGIVEKLDAEYRKDAQNTHLTSSDLEKTFDFKRGTLTGIYDFKNQVRVGPRVYDSLPGFHVITPLKLDDGSDVLVNRGWVSEHWTFADEINPPAGTVQVTGLLRPPSKDNPFRPENAPDKDQWYDADPEQIAAAKNLSRVHKYILYVEGSETDNYPLPLPGRLAFENNHLYYAFFWFTMAGILVLVFIMRFVKK